jgi:phospholipid transport system transporter-binding protein
MTMLVLPATLTHGDAVACLRMLEQSVRAQSTADVVADAAPLQRFDSSALAVLLACRREAQHLQKTFAVKGMPDRLRDLAVLFGVAELLPPAV